MKKYILSLATAVVVFASFSVAQDDPRVALGQYYADTRPFCNFSNWTPNYYDNYSVYFGLMNGGLQFSVFPCSSPTVGYPVGAGVYSLLLVGIVPYYQGIYGPLLASDFGPRTFGWITSTSSPTASITNVSVPVDSSIMYNAFSYTILSSSDMLTRVAGNTEFKNTIFTHSLNSWASWSFYPSTNEVIKRTFAYPIDKFEFLGSGGMYIGGARMLNYLGEVESVLTEKYKYIISTTGSIFGYSYGSWYQLVDGGYVYITSTGELLPNDGFSPGEGNVPIASQVPGPPTVQCQQYWRAESNMAYYVDTCLDETIQTNTGYQYVFDIYGMRSVDAGTITGTLEELNVEYNNYACASAVVLARTTKAIYSSGTYTLLLERAWNRAQGPINEYLDSESQAYGEAWCRDNGDTVGDVLIGSGYLTDLLQYDYGSGYNYSSSALVIGGMKNCLRGFGFNMLWKIGDPPVNIQQESQSPIGVVNCVLLALTPNLSDTGEYPFSDIIPAPPACMVVEGGSTVSLLIFRSCIMGLTFPMVRYIILPSNKNN